MFSLAVWQALTTLSSLLTSVFTKNAREPSSPRTSLAASSLISSNVALPPSEIIFLAQANPSPETPPVIIALTLLIFIIYLYLKYICLN